MKKISPNEYETAFGVNSTPQENCSTNARQRIALEHALDIRKFEIQLYWTRATYFWAIIGASLGAYGVVQVVPEPQRTDLSVFLSSLGIVFSFAWFCANRGSKKWQENWENHVDLLENEIIGPLYKTVISRPPATGIAEKTKHFLTGPAPYSVSKINQIISVYICSIWLLLLAYALRDFACNNPFPKTYLFSIFIAASACLAIGLFARTTDKKYTYVVRMREGKIEN